MASGRDRQSPTLGLIPPPVAPPRRRSPINFQGQETKLPDEQRQPPVPARRTSLPIKKNVSDFSIEEETGTDVSVKDNKLPTLSEVDNRFSAPQLTHESIYHPDLDGLDFSLTGSTFSNIAGESRPRSSSMEELKTNAKPIYPDIRHVFKDITESQIANPSLRSYGASQFKNNGSSIQPTSVRSSDGLCSTPPPLPSHSAGSYGWNASFFAKPSYYNNSGQYFNPQATNSGNLQYPPHSASNPSVPSNNNFSLFNPASQVNFGLSTPYSSAAYDHQPVNNNNDMLTGSSSKFGYIPNISLPRPASCGEVYTLRESSASPTDNTRNPIAIAGLDESFFPVGPTTQALDGDLIKLGEALPEHEYLSLDYFDPLYSRGRKESVSYGDNSSAQPLSRQTFSFGEAFPSFYMAHSHQNGSAAYDQATDDHIWMPDKAPPLSAKSPPIGFEAFNFDEFGVKTFGSSEEEFLKGSPPIIFSSAAYDAAPVNEIRRNVSGRPPRPPSWRVSQDKRFEGLRKRTFIDPESESFCQMVADLKKSYLSTDEKTNQGYLINQIREYHTGTTSVKVTVYTQFSAEPVLFTCDTNSDVDLIISHVLYTVAPTDPQPDTNKFILKVYDRTEYLCNGLPLAKFDYVHSCQKLDRDICLELVSCEEVSRPFIRTRDDDIQMLYFPKEYINPDGTAVSQDALSVYLDTFYHEIDVLMEHFNEGDNFHIQGLQQSIKALCVSLARIETVEMTKTLDKLCRNIAELTNPSSKSQIMYGGGHQDKDTQEALNVAIRCSLLEDLQSTVDQLLDAVKRLVRMYCRTFLTDFFLGSSIEVPHDHLEVVKVKDNFIVSISSAHRIPEGWTHKYEEYKIVCSLYHGTKKLARDVSTTLKPLSTGLCERIYWDEWLNFEKMSLCTIPRETRLCLMLCGVTSLFGAADKNQDKGEVLEGKKVIYPLGAAAIQLFNEKGYLNQGPQLVPLMMGVSSDPIMPSCKTLLPDSVLLQVNLPEFDRTIFFQDPLNNLDSSSKSFDELTPMIRSLVHNVMEKEGCSVFTAEEYDTLWRYRHYMTEYPSLLPRILQAAQSWDWASLPEIYSLLRSWKPLHPMQAFELLLPEFPDLRVRQFAADSLNKISSDDLVDFLPQMIQGLKFESYHNSPLAKLLLEQACKSPRFAHQFFWLLKGAAAQDATFKRRYELMFVALASVAGDALYQEFKKQEELVKVMTSVAEKVKAAKDKDNTLKTELIPLHEMLEQKARVLLPYNPSVEVVGLDMKSCSYFTSNAFPLKLVFKNSNPKADSHYVIYKVGDDLRQDMLTLQMIRIMDNLWLQQGLDLKMILFACLATGPKKGVIELVTESETLRKIQVSSGVTGSFKDRPIKEWLQKHNPTERDYLRVNMTLLGYETLAVLKGTLL
ncbi:unnamed protein product [Lymnaea stagnalis]|uniref:phosphatidylinositol 3-kinase n=1 Tax=Lymnaea stagnalis TaxID=6523 RepID=A0AAV2HS42_LYMST